MIFWVQQLCEAFNSYLEVGLQIVSEKQRIDNLLSLLLSTILTKKKDFQMETINFWNEKLIVVFSNSHRTQNYG